MVCGAQTERHETRCAEGPHAELFHQRVIATFLSLHKVTAAEEKHNTYILSLGFAGLNTEDVSIYVRFGSRQKTRFLFFFPLMRVAFASPSITLFEEETRVQKILANDQTAGEK